MAEVTDILIDHETGDLAARNGDLMIGESTRQHQASLMFACEGDYKQTPLAGIGAINFLDDEGPENFMRRIRQQFTQDGMAVTRLYLDDSGKLITVAEYK